MSNQNCSFYGQWLKIDPRKIDVEFHFGSFYPLFAALTINFVFKSPCNIASQLHLHGSVKSLLALPDAG